MSLLRKPRFQRVGSTWESIVDFFSGRNRRRARGGRNRRLMIDPLEQRTLLSLTVTPVNLSDQLVNQTPGDQWTGDLITEDPTDTTIMPSLSSSTGVSTTQAVGVNNNGDFVVTWTRYD